MASLDLLGSVEATEIAPDVFLLTARGTMDGRMKRELRDMLVPLAAADGAIVVLDLVDAHCLDEETVAVVGVAAHLALRHGSRVRVATGSRAVLELLGEWGVDDLVTIDATVREAIARG